ncbi:MAG: hypothetical protein PVJ28_10290 [Acidimicrobiia bacterium]|jgi:hypothetical protein
MQGVITHRLAGLGLAAVLTLTAAGGAVAVFAAGGPGEDLRATGSADALIDLTQVRDSIRWTSLAGNVAAVQTVGWPSSDGLHDLGGALTIEQPANPMAGTIDIGEKPMSVSFELDG